MSVGENIHNLRSRADISQEELASQLNVSVLSVSEWESRMSNPSMDQILQMCGVFSCSLDELLRGESQIEAVSDDFIKQHEHQMKSYANIFSLAVGVFFFGVSAVLILLSLDYSIGLVSLCFIPFVILSMVLGIKSSCNFSAYAEKYPHLPTMYSKERIEKEESRLGLLMFAGIAIAGFGVFLLVRRSALPVLSEMSTLFSVGVFIIVLGIAVMMFVNIVIRFNIYDVSSYNKENAPKKSQ